MGGKMDSQWKEIDTRREMGNLMRQVEDWKKRYEDLQHRIRRAIILSEDGSASDAVQEMLHELDIPGLWDGIDVDELARKVREEHV